MLFYQILAFAILGKNINKSYNKNKFKISNFLSHIQDYFKYITKKHETVTDNPPIRIYANKIENRLTIKQDIISNF